MNIYRCESSQYSGVLFPEVRSFRQGILSRKQWKLSTGFDLGEAKKFSENPILLQEILIPLRPQKISAEELAEFKERAMEILNAEASPCGWQFHSLPVYEARQETLENITDESHRLAMEECLRVIDRLSDDWHDMLHDLGAKGRRESYRTMPTTFYVFATQVK